MRHAIIVGAGQIGRAAAERFARSGWRVSVLSRSGASWDGADPSIAFAATDRSDSASFRRAIGDGADFLIDTVAFDAPDAAQLLDLQDRVGAIAAISSASVYCDDEGRTIDEAATNGFPRLPLQVTEAQSTVSAGPQTYSTRKIAMERTLLDGARVPAAIHRPCAIHGVGSRHPREWWFVKRLLDGRRRIPLAHDGRSRFQTSSTVNMAELLLHVAERRLEGILNAVDPDSPTVLEIGEFVARTLQRQAEFVPLEGMGGGAGLTPFSLPFPLTCSDQAARRAGYNPVVAYRETAADYVRWLASVPPEGWEARFPQLAAYPFALFDYEAEDAAISTIERGSTAEP